MHFARLDWCVVETSRQKSAAYTAPTPGVIKTIEGEKLPMQPSMREQPSAKSTPPYATTYERASGGEPFKVIFTGHGIDVAGRLATPKDADDFVSAINALKLLLRPIGVAKPNQSPDVPTRQED